MSDDTRAQLRAQIKALETSISVLEVARSPFDAAISAVCDVKESLLDHHEAEIAGTCEGCAKIILAGDIGYRDDDVTLCETCAPTWGDCKEQTEAALNLDPDDDDRTHLHAFLARVAAHVAGGGSLSDKYTREL